MRRLALLAPLALFAFACSSPAATATYTSHQLHAAIPDGGTLAKSIAVPDAGPVSFVAVGVRIVHPRDSDLTLKLVSPRGTSLLLSAGAGGNGANYGSGPKGCSGELTWFEADAFDRIATAKAPFAGEVVPEGHLVALYGQEARGRWTLQVTDSRPGAAGTLLCWQLEVGRNIVSHDTVTRGPVSADLTYRETNSFYRDLRISIRRHGALALTTPVDRISCKDCSVSGISTIMGQPLRIIDLDGDGEPEVLVDLYTGGAHCCWFTLFLRWDGRTYRSTQHLWGDPSYDLTDLDHDGRPELVSADDRFAYAFTSYAASALPIQIWRYDRGTLTDVTPSYPALVRKDAASLWTDYLQTRNQNGADERGLLAAWLADEYRLGLAKDGWGKIRAAYARGELSAPRVDPLWPAGQKYVTALRIFLAKNGY